MRRCVSASTFWVSLLHVSEQWLCNVGHHKFRVISPADGLMPLLLLLSACCGDPDHIFCAAAITTKNTHKTLRGPFTGLPDGCSDLGKSQAFANNKTNIGLRSVMLLRLFDMKQFGNRTWDCSAHCEMAASNFLSIFSTTKVARIRHVCE